MGDEAELAYDADVQEPRGSLEISRVKIRGCLGHIPRLSIPPPYFMENNNDLRPSSSSLRTSAAFLTPVFTTAF